MSSKNQLNGIIACYDTYTLYHHVTDGQLGPATNLTHESIKLIFKSTIKQAKQKIIFMKWKSLIPENVLHFDANENSVIFYTQPMFKKLFFSEDLKIQSAHYKTPFLLWKYKNGKLSVFALKKKPVSENEELYHAPFMNISRIGDVCMGSVKYGNEENYFDFLIEDIVDKFFNSYFSHTNHNDLLKMNYMDFLKNHAENKDFSFAKYLVETKKQIKSLL